MAMTENQKLSYKAIDAVVNIWTREALSHRPDWGDEFFVGKMNAENALMAGLSPVSYTHLTLPTNREV